MYYVYSLVFPCIPVYSLYSRYPVYSLYSRYSRYSVCSGIPVYSVYSLYPRAPREALEPRGPFLHGARCGGVCRTGCTRVPVACPGVYPLGTPLVMPTGTRVHPVRHPPATPRAAQEWPSGLNGLAG